MRANVHICGNCLGFQSKYMYDIYLRGGGSKLKIERGGGGRLIEILDKQKKKKLKIKEWSFGLWLCIIL